MSKPRVIFRWPVYRADGGFTRVNKVRYLDTSGPSMARRSTRPWERRHLLSTDWGVNTWIDFFKATFPPLREIYFLIVRPYVDDARSTKSIARLRLVRQRKQ